ncbi:conserved membrane hypothetical protein [Hyella patelloides LEGE 07179]|uniref:Oligosaccharide repeat unit polymerase n=1 Tax=Hyella patelloides LEGE 07179 TaxID=945734 RepID=A0A563VLD5_9CYAN|nr:hypothetical protein [Hyella patelloides]VEP12249.1 conserved membrane hypothetical protein [Hyella patelloides LEGE 07179]
MVELYFGLFIIACAFLILWGLVYLERAYQYPFLTGSIFISFLIPQGFALYNNPEAVDTNGLARVFLMCFLCALMCLIGYQLSPNNNVINYLNVKVNEQKLFKAGIGLLVIGTICNAAIRFVAIETDGHSNGWTGKATILVFFGRLTYIALAIFLMELLKRPSMQNFVFTAIAAYYPIRSIVIGGRRQPTMVFLIIIGLSFWFVRRSIPPRWFFLLAIVAITFLIPFLGYNRDAFQDITVQDWEQLQTSSQDSLEFITQGKVLELRNAAVLMKATSQTGRYGYGTGYWDAIIFQFFPGQIFGHELKDALQLRWGLGHFKRFYDYYVTPGSTNTGIGDAFAEFDYFGSLIFAGIGYLFKNLWISANYYQSVFSKLLYIGLVTPAMVCITHGTQRFFQEALFQFIFIGLAVHFSQEKTFYRAIPKKSVAYHE